MKFFSEIVSKLWTNEISQEDLVNNYKNKITEKDIINGLEVAFNKKDEKETESIFHIAFTFDLFTQESIQILGKFISQTWHKQHEEIARVFQKLKNPNSIQSIMEGVHIKCDYWFDNGDAFIRKCLYALAEINTSESISKINILANDSNEIIKKYSLEQLKELTK